MKRRPGFQRSGVGRHVGQWRPGSPQLRRDGSRAAGVDVLDGAFPSCSSRYVWGFSPTSLSIRGGFVHVARARRGEVSCDKTANSRFDGSRSVRRWHEGDTLFWRQNQRTVRCFGAMLRSRLRCHHGGPMLVRPAMARTCTHRLFQHFASEARPADCWTAGFTTLALRYFIQIVLKLFLDPQHRTFVAPIMSPGRVSARHWSILRLPGCLREISGPPARARLRSAGGGVPGLIPVNRPVGSARGIQPMHYRSAADRIARWCRRPARPGHVADLRASARFCPDGRRGGA